MRKPEVITRPHEYKDGPDCINCGCFGPIDDPNDEPTNCKGGITLTKEEALILQKLLKGWVVGPSAQKVLDKLNAIKE
jgi:hypothetical protein